MIEPATPSIAPRAGLVRAAGLGLMSGIGFIVPALAYRSLPPGEHRTIALAIAAVVAILLVRTAGRLLRPVLDATAREWRIAVIGLYGLVAMGLVVVMLLR